MCVYYITIHLKPEGQTMTKYSRGQLRADPHLNNNELIRSPLMSTIIYHNHHIIPRYRCKEIGIHPDFEGNIIRLTRLEHAEAHYHRWLKNGRSEDLGAAQLLAEGEIGGIDSSGKNNSFYGKKHSPEALKKISEASKGKKNSFYGKKHSDASRRKISEGCQGKIRSAESRKRISESMTGVKRKPFTEEHKRKLSESGKRRWAK